MIKKISRQQILIEHPDLPRSDHNNNEYTYPKTFANYLLALPYRSTRGLAKIIAKEITTMMTLLHLDSLIFLGDDNRPWLYQQNDHKPVQAALQYLSDHKVTKKFNGALEIYTSELEIFLVHFFWLVRCNAALPTFYFIDVNDSLIGNICSYGNLHLDVTKKTEVEKITAAISKTKFEEIDSCQGDRIPGRQIIV